MHTVNVKGEATVEALVEAVLMAVTSVDAGDLHREYARQLRHAAEIVENRIDDECTTTTIKGDAR